MLVLIQMNPLILHKDSGAQKNWLALARILATFLILFPQFFHSYQSPSLTDILSPNISKTSLLPLLHPHFRTMSSSQHICPPDLLLYLPESIICPPALLKSSSMLSALPIKSLIILKIRSTLIKIVQKMVSYIPSSLIICLVFKSSNTKPLTILCAYPVVSCF
jgi:hypothetical protein